VKPTQRRDYLRNLKAKEHTGCAWCGGTVPPPVTIASHCSDACVQADNEGIDDMPPVIPLAYTDPAYVARKWSGRP
jgi:hypothetical protein